MIRLFAYLVLILIGTGITLKVIVDFQYGELWFMTNIFFYVFQFTCFILCWDIIRRVEVLRKNSLRERHTALRNGSGVGKVILSMTISKRFSLKRNISQAVAQYLTALPTRRYT